MPKGKSLGSPGGEGPCVSAWVRDVRCCDQKAGCGRLCFPKMAVLHSTWSSNSVTGCYPIQGWCPFFLSWIRVSWWLWPILYGGCDSMGLLRLDHRDTDWPSIPPSSLTLLPSPLPYSLSFSLSPSLFLTPSFGPQPLCYVEALYLDTDNSSESFSQEPASPPDCVNEHAFGWFQPLALILPSCCWVEQRHTLNAESYWNCRPISKINFVIYYVAIVT